MVLPPTDFTDGKDARARAIRRHADLVKCIEAAIDAFGQLRGQGIDLASMPRSMLEARTALWKAHDDLMTRAPRVTAAEFLEFHGAATP